MDYERKKNEILFAKIYRKKNNINKFIPLIIGINAVLTYAIILLMIIFFVN